MSQPDFHRNADLWAIVTEFGGSLGALAVEVRRLRAVVAAVRALHHDGHTAGNERELCRGCRELWPCPTVRALDESAGLGVIERHDGGTG